jgi:hypothetical protein
LYLLKLSHLEGAAEEEAIDGVEGEGGERGEVEMTAVASGSGGDFVSKSGCSMAGNGGRTIGKERCNYQF